MKLITDNPVYLGVIPCLSRRLGVLLEPDCAVREAADAMKSQRSQSFIAGRALLKAALCHEGVLKAREAMPVIRADAGGKPAFCNEIAQIVPGFNISHSDGVLALAVGPDSQGIDIELVSERRLRPALLGRVLNERERQLLEALPGRSEQAAFFARQWTIREALLKVTGRSIFAMDSLDIDPEAMTVRISDSPSGWLLFTSVHLSVSSCPGSEKNQHHAPDFCAFCPDSVRNEGIKTQLCCSYENQGRFMGYHFADNITCGISPDPAHDDKGRPSVSYALCFFHKSDICPEKITVMVHNDSFSVPPAQALRSCADVTEAGCAMQQVFTRIDLVPEAVIAVNRCR